MKTQKFQVTVNIAASEGIAQTKTVDVDAADKADALVRASFKLEGEGYKRWSLQRIAQATS